MSIIFFFFGFQSEKQRAPAAWILFPLSVISLLVLRRNVNFFPLTPLLTWMRRRMRRRKGCIPSSICIADFFWYDTERIRVPSRIHSPITSSSLVLFRSVPYIEKWIGNMTAFLKKIPSLSIFVSLQSARTDSVNIFNPLWNQSKRIYQEFSIVCFCVYIKAESPVVRVLIASLYNIHNRSD